MTSEAKKLRVAAAVAKHKAAADASNNARNDITSPSSPSKDTLQATVAALALKSPPKAGTNKLRAAALALKITGAATPWGDFSHLVNADISSLSNEKLKRHLSTRNEVAEGTKQELIERLRNSLKEEREEDGDRIGNRGQA